VLSGVLTIVLWSIGLRWVAFLLLFWVTVAGFGLAALVRRAGRS
jgi:hypothetical protein